MNKRHRRWDFCLGTKLLLLFIFLQQNTKQNSICIDDDSVNWSLFQTKYFHLKKLSSVTWKLSFFLNPFGYLPFQSISDVTNIMFGFPFACQSSELLPTVRKPCLPTLPHAKRCSIQVPPKTSFHFHFLFHFLKTFSIPGTS